MQRILLCCALALTLFACTDEALMTEAGTPTVQQDPLTKAELNKLVEAHLFATNEVFNWNETTDHVIWSALELSQNEAVLGYQPAGYENLRETIHEIDVNSGAWKSTRDALVADLLAATERLTGNAITEEELFVSPEDGVLPILDIKVLHPGILAEFRTRPEVRYLEPSNYNAGEVELRSGSGCSEAPTDNINAADFTTISPNAKQPWNYAWMNIPQAWTRTQGDNIGIAIIDTGVYPEQDKLGSAFSSGSSTGRTISKFGTYEPSFWSSSTDGPNDQCGHGTQMAGLAAAPRTSAGNTVGVAYKANLVTYRATSDVIINGSKEKKGVKNALVAIGNRSDVKIVSMSIGDVFSSGTVEDGIYYAYNRGKLILCAAGTSLSWTSWYGVIFPANMSVTTAVTGIRSSSPMQRCNTCHDGSAVDFVIVMQRGEDSDRTSLTLSRFNNNPGYVGGSSAATATTAGIAALVWATNPSQSRAQVLDRLKQASSIYPGRSGSFGWGLIDANAATQ
ncbi:S8 family serine peptidase [Neolewinella lacunae]|uniref:S8 family serine peptidase n=1 Tax=Neolewinella lacunae TaxID=1517758 RepID=A0A923PMG3_9BACT|nr:S8 family serine peptidase [Neolewinella lacunae]MBC6993888.1 S8 family serine peptidase [Neolewinella lacunae]MDN3637051.1 S8 family serine peptidase [Neolewinella lacunae]